MHFQRWKEGWSYGRPIPGGNGSLVKKHQYTENQTGKRRMKRRATLETHDLFLVREGSTRSRYSVNSQSQSNKAPRTLESQAAELKSDKQTKRSEDREVSPYVKSLYPQLECQGRTRLLDLDLFQLELF